MPVWLARLLPHLGLALLLAGTVWWIDHRGYARAIAARDAHDARMLAALNQALRASEQRLAGAIAQIGTDYERERRLRDARFAAAQRDLTEEIARDPRLSDPAAGLTPGLLATINSARAAGACAADAAGRITCPLPAARPGR